MECRARDPRAATQRRHTDQQPHRESMSSWFERHISSHQVQLAATALLSGATVAGLIYGGQAIRRRVAVEQLKASIPPIDDEHQAQRVRRFICSNHQLNLPIDKCPKPSS